MQFVKDYRYLVEDERTEGELMRTPQTSCVDYIQTLCPKDRISFAEHRLVAIAAKWNINTEEEFYDDYRTDYTYPP